MCVCLPKDVSVMNCHHILIFKLKFLFPLYYAEMDRYTNIDLFICVCAVREGIKMSRDIRKMLKH